jgi:16S rRNA (adenine1518-N6/adenine1519-N6)-dimethyltransferase
MNETLHIRAKKSLGQNFLIDKEALYDIAYSVVVRDKNIVEVGPGYGALTDYLIEGKPETLTLVELDTDMIEILEKKYTKNITILHQDVLQFVPHFSEYSVIANIPYYITSPILFHFLYASGFVPPESMVIMMQEEVGEKILE